MKTSKIILVLVLSLAFAPSAFAVKRAPFPNSKPLQPIPTNVQPNISGNVNTDSVLPATETPTDAASQGEPTTSVQGNVSDQGTGTIWAVWIVIVAAFFGGFYLRFRSKRQEIQLRSVKDADYVRIFNARVQCAMISI